jgi:hypothetical protein
VSRGRILSSFSSSTSQQTRFNERARACAG